VPPVSTPNPPSLVELRVLEGPNLYFPRAAVKLTLDLTGLIEAEEDRAARFATRIGLKKARPGAAGSGFRQRFAMRAVARLVRQVAGESGTTRLAVRVRPTNDVHRIVVAYPWRHRSRAQALGQAVAGVLDALPAPDLDAPSEGPRRRGHRHQRQDHDLPDGRPHRAHPRHARRLVEHRRYLRRRRARRAR
jgi:hypothetical protein